MHHSGNAIVRHQKVRFFFRLYPDLVQQIINALRQMQHRLSALKMIDKTLFGFLKFRSVPRCGLIPAKILLCQTNFLPRRNPCDL